MKDRVETIHWKSCQSSMAHWNVIQCLTQVVSYSFIVNSDFCNLSVCSRQTVYPVLVFKYVFSLRTSKVAGICVWKMPCIKTSGVEQNDRQHDDVTKWKHFPRYWPFVRGIHQSPVNSPHKGQWHGALMFSWVNNGEAGDMRRHRPHYDVSVMFYRRHFKYVLLNENQTVLIQIPFKFVPKVRLTIIHQYSSGWIPKWWQIISPEPMLTDIYGAIWRHYGPVN